MLLFRLISIYRIFPLGECLIILSVPRLDTLSKDAILGIDGARHILSLVSVILRSLSCRAKFDVGVIMIGVKSTEDYLFPVNSLISLRSRWIGGLRDLELVSSEIFAF